MTKKVQKKSRQARPLIEKRVTVAALKIQLLRRSGGGLLTRAQVDKVFNFLQGELDAAKNDLLQSNNAIEFTL